MTGGLAALVAVAGRPGVFTGVFTGGEVPSGLTFVALGLPRAVDAIDDDVADAGGDVGGVGVSFVGSGATATIGDAGVTEIMDSMVFSASGDRSGTPTDGFRTGTGEGVCAAGGEVGFVGGGGSLESASAPDVFCGGHSRRSFASSFAASAVVCPATLVRGSWKPGGRGVPGPMELRFPCCSKRPIKLATLWRGRSSGRGL